MALDNYDNLVKSIIKWSHRDDLDLLIPDFIQLAEEEFYSPSLIGVPSLDVRELEGKEIVETVASSREVNLPTGFGKNRQVRLNIGTGDSGKLKFKAPEQLIINNASGQPRYYTITDKLIFDRVPDAIYEVEFTYIKKINGLSSVSQTNDILTNYPNIYLYGALHQAFIYADDEVKANKYQIKFVNAIKGANKQTKRGRYGTAPTARVEGPTP